MIDFPEFKTFELSDRAFIESHVKRYKPYSDYNFTSLWSWNVHEKMGYSILNHNLVVRFTDYVNNEPFYSFLGSRDIDTTINTLLTFIREKGHPPILRLVPQEVVDLIENTAFQINEDSANHDFILSVPELVDYRGKHLRGKRNFVNRFKRLYSSTTKLLDICDQTVQQQLKELFFLWGARKNLKPSEIDNEFNALSRLFGAAASANYLVVGVFVDKALIGFSINEIVHQEHMVLHFEKADTTSFTGIYPYIMQETARFALSQGVRFINYEQDLGIAGLKHCKQSYHPCAFLKKYSLARANGPV